MSPAEQKAYADRISSYQQSAERSRIRRRYLYALVFHENDRVYIGQSVSPSRRDSQHKTTWGRQRFSMHVLGSITGTYQQAEDMEYAWRQCAHERGFEIYGLKGILVNPASRMTPERLALAARLRWPSSARRQGRIRRAIMKAGLFMLAWVALAGIGWYFMPDSFRAGVRSAAHFFVPGFF